MDALPTPRLRWRWEGQRPNVVLLSLSLFMLVVFWALDVVSIAPNRIAAGTGFSALDALGWPGVLLATLLLTSLVLFSWQPSQPHYRAQLAAVTAIMALMPLGLITSRYLLIDAELPQARIVIGPAYWVVLFVLFLCLVEIRLRLNLSRGWPMLLLSGVALVWWLCGALWLDSLALVQEFKIRDRQWLTAMTQHVTLVGMSVGVSIILGLSLALLMRRYSRFQKGAFAILNGLQTIPSLAIFGLLLWSLTWLAAKLPFLAHWGVSGSGTTPVFIALIAYGLLPIVRHTYSALEHISAETLELANAMGMRSGQRFWQVRLPLAIPVLIEGVRITTVHAIGLTAVAALIGAGGLGTFIFEGLDQNVMEMVLLGALPILIMALIVDAGLSALADALRPGGLQ